jgi:tyrosine-protein kinase Etk/Wzc
MNQSQTATNAPASEARASNFDLIELLIVLAKHRKSILYFPVAVAVLAAALSFVIPNVYLANTKLLPPQQAQSGAAALLSQLGGIAGAAAGVAGIKSPNDLYIGMLKSRTIADRLVAKFDLKNVYDLDTLAKTRKELEENTVITAGKDGLITIEVEDENQQRVAKIANAYVSELIELTKVIAVTEASQRRMFYEAQLTQAKNNLAKAEMDLKGAFDTRGVISVDGESRAIVETVGRLRAQISAKEIQLSSMRAFVTTSNPEFLRAQEELTSLRSELSKLENGRPGLASVPDESGKKQVGLENIKLLRDVKYYQMLYELLAKQFEVARLDEAKDSAVIQVLDPATEPERKFKPKRALIVIFSALLALVLETYKRFSTSPGRFAQLVELKSHFHSK